MDAAGALAEGGFQPLGGSQSERFERPDRPRRDSKREKKANMANSMDINSGDAIGMNGNDQAG